MIGKSEAELVIKLPKFYFLYYNLEQEYSEVITLKLEGVRPHLEGDKTPSRGKEKEISTELEEEIHDKET